MAAEVVVILPQWRTTREVYRQGIEVSRELVAVLERRPKGVPDGI